MNIHQKKTVRLLACLLLIFCFLYGSILLWGNRLLHQALARLEEDQRPMNFAYLHPHAIPDQENALNFYKIAILRLKTSPIGKETLYSQLQSISKQYQVKKPGKSQLPPKAYETFQQCAETKDFKEAMTFVEMGANQKECVFDLDYSTLNRLKIDDLVETTSLSRILKTTVDYQIDQGHPDLAWKSAYEALSLASQQREPILMAYVIRIFHEKNANQSIRQLCEIAAPTPDLFTKMDQLLSKAADPSSFIRAIDGDRLLFFEQFSNEGQEKLSSDDKNLFRKIEVLSCFDLIPGAMNFEWAGLFDMQRNLITLPKHTVQDWYRGPEQNAMEHLPWYSFCTRRYCASAFDSIGKKYYLSLRDNLITRIGLNLVHFKQVHGKYPLTLEECGIGNPIDPFTGTPFIYHPQGEGFEIEGINRDTREKLQEKWTSKDFDDYLTTSWKMNH